MSLDRFISPYVAGQFPRIYREEGPAFIAFVKAYYEWMETSGQVNDETGKLTAYRDIDTTLDEFIVYFKNKYMNGIPEGILGDKRLLQKHIKEIYSSKGTERGLQLLFQLLIGEGVQVYYPGDDILKPSDGTWLKQQYVEVTANPLNALLVGEPIRGRESGATAVVEDFQTRYINRRHINILYLSNVNGTFVTGELLLNSVMTDPLKSPNVVGSLTDVLMNESGFDFSVGDVLSVEGGSGTGGQVVVAETANKSGVIEFTIEDGGSGYTSSLNATSTAFAPNYLIINKSNNDSTGIGAEFKVGQLSNIEFIFASNTIIAPYANVGLDSSDYMMPGGSAETINTPLDQALTYMDLEVGTIKTLRAINPGNNYVGPVTVDLTNPVVAGYNLPDEDHPFIKGENAHIRGDAAYGEGAIVSVTILDSGYGYQEGDTIELISNTNPSIAGGVVALGRHGHDAGRWRDTKSFLNSNKYIQDSFYYQDYSYETKTSMAFNQYSDILKRLWHPAGTELFGKISVAMEIDNGSMIEDAYIAQIYLTEYHTQFNTLLETNRLTASLYGTLFATTYSTTAPTTTTRSTRTSAYQSFQELVVNGGFTASVANWTAVSTAVQVWDASAKLKVTITGGSGATKQTLNTIIGNSYYLAGEYSGATGTGGTLSVANSSSGTIVSVAKTGAANTFGVSFVADSTTTDVILTTTGVNGQFALWDNISVKALPLVSQATFQNYDTTFVTLKNTQFATSKVTSSAYDTAIFTAYDTSKATQSLFDTAFLTNRGTTTAFVTSFNTLNNTLFLTDTLRTTFGVANRATSTGYTTSYASTFDTIVATLTTLNTGLDTMKDTSGSTATLFSTNVLTNRSTDTGAVGSKETQMITSKSTDSVYVTAFNTLFLTNRATATSQSTNTTTSKSTGTSKSTTTAYATAFATSRATATTVSTSRASGTSILTSRATSTSFQTARTTDTSVSTATVYNTTTAFATGTSGSTGTVFGTTTAYESAPAVTQTATTYDTLRYTASLTGGKYPQDNNHKATWFSTSKATDTGRATFYTTTAEYITHRRSLVSYTVPYGIGFTEADVPYNTIKTVETSRLTTDPVSRGTQTTVSTTTAFNTETSKATITSKSTSTFFGTTTNFETSQSTSTAFVSNFDTTTTYDSGFNTTTAYNTNRATSKSTTSAFNTTTAFATATSTVYNTTTNYDTSRATSQSTSVSTTTSFATLYSTASGAVSQTTTAYDSIYDTNKSTSTVFQTLMNTLVGTSASTSTAYGTQIITSRATAKDTNTAYITNFETAFATGTNRNTTYDTSRATNKGTNTIYTTVAQTATTAFTAFGTSKNSMFGTVVTTSTSYDSAVNTDAITTGTTQTQILTEYIIIPTLYTTSFNTNTQRGTEYITSLATTVSTESYFNTGYDTMYLTSLNTESDLL